MGWKLGESSDLDAMLEAQVLSSVLMENSASPLMKWLETNDLGTALLLCGLEESMREMVMCCGIEGSEASRADEFEASVLEVIRKTRRRRVRGETRGDSASNRASSARSNGRCTPYGLNLMLRALGATTTVMQLQRLT